MIAAIRRRARGEAAADHGAAARQDALDLLQLVTESQSSGAERHALIVRLSLLPKGRAPAHHVRLARAALDPLFAAPRARLFQPPGTDLVMVWRGEAGAALHASLRGLAYLFADDLLPDPAALTQHLTLPADAAALEALAAGSLQPPGPARVATRARQPLDLASLAVLETRLAQADVARFARRRDICTLGADGRFVRAWEKRFLSVEELSQALLPDRAARADVWLFRRLTRTLDRRMLALLAAPGELRGAGPFSLNLNVSGVLAPEFLRFDAALPAALRGRVVIDLSPADLLADPAAFVFARDFAHARGYRLLLRGVTASLLPVLPLDPTGLDWLQLRWSQAFAGIDDLGAPAARMVLGRTDSPAAVEWGRRRGIGYFTGAAVAAEKSLADATEPRVAPAFVPDLGDRRAAPRSIVLGGAPATA